MDAAQQKLLDDMNEAYQARYEACKKYKEACKAFVESSEKTPEFMEKWEWLEAEESGSRKPILGVILPAENLSEYLNAIKEKDGN